MSQKGHSSAASFYGTFMAILMIIVALTFVDLMLVGVDRNEREQEAERYYEAGQEFVAAGNYDRAVDSFRSAFSIYREETRFQLAYANALYNAGRLNEAEATARDLLENSPTNADAALIMARILVGQPSQASQDEGVSFYHRAIFGRWADEETDPEAAAERTLQTRLELADLLASNEADEELLAELLPLRDEATGKLDLSRRIAGLYIDAGAPERAGELYREILDQSPEDPGAYAGLGEAEFALSNYRTAAQNFETALRFAPDDAAIRRRLQVTNQVLDLDPLGRNLTSRQRYDRSLMLLEMTMDSLTACTGPEPDYLTLTLADKADELLNIPIREVEDFNDAVEENLNLAEQIWDLRVAACGEPNDDEEPIALVLTRAAQ